MCVDFFLKPLSGLLELVYFGKVNTSPLTEILSVRKDYVAIADLGKFGTELNSHSTTPVSFSSQCDIWFACRLN